MWSTKLASNSEIEITGESGTLDEAVEMIRIKRPDIVLLDINLVQGSGLDGVPLIRKFSPGTRIIAVSMHNEPAYVKRMMKLGAKAYVTKNSSHEEIKDILSDQLITIEPKDQSRRDLSYR